MLILFIPKEERERMKREHDICREADADCSGYLPQEPKFGKTSKNEPKVTFGVCYRRKKYMNVCCTGDNEITRIASCLEAHDTVNVKGTWRSKHYTNRDGEEKEWEELYADFLQVQQDVPAQAAPSTADESYAVNTDDADLPFGDDDIDINL